MRNVCHFCWWLLTNITRTPSSHNLLSYVFSIPRRPAVKIRLLRVDSVYESMPALRLCWLLISFQQWRDLSCTPGSDSRFNAANYNLSAEFHGSGRSNTRKDFCFPVHEIFGVKSLFLKGYVLSSSWSVLIYQKSWNGILQCSLWKGHVNLPHFLDFGYFIGVFLRVSESCRGG